MDQNKIDRHGEAPESQAGRQTAKVDGFRVETWREVGGRR